MTSMTTTTTPATAAAVVPSLPTHPRMRGSQRTRMPLWRFGAADVILDYSEQSLVADNAFRLSSLNAVLEQLKPLNCDALSVQVENALQLEVRRSRCRAQTNPNVARAMLLEREMELADYARRNAREAVARKQSDLRLKTIKDLRAEQEALHQRRLDLQSASTVVERACRPQKL